MNSIILILNIILIVLNIVYAIRINRINYLRFVFAFIIVNVSVVVMGSVVINLGGV